jgi:hypothetical protein
MTYRLNGQIVTSEEFLRNAKGIRPGFAPMISCDYSEYNCPITGKVISGKKEHKENLQRHGCRLFEKGEREHFIKTSQREKDEKIEKMSEQAVINTVKNLPDSFWKG